jgi:hypothetical protein
MVKPWYTAAESFDPTWGDNWTTYFHGAGLPQLVEVITLDCSLCPSSIKDLTPEDWEHNIPVDFSPDLFHDLDYLLKRVAGMEKTNILAVVRNPTEQCAGAFEDSRFAFKGYDLVEVEGGISALTNCGGFPLAFRNEELSNCGLIATLARAREVQQALREHYPDEHHADCNIWALWKMK